MKTVIVSLHDVSPSSQEVVESMISQLNLLGIKQVSLLVIPDYHGREPLEKYPLFLSWLIQKEKEGHEILLHGYYHLRRENKKESFFQKLITECYTRGEGEFYDLNYHQAKELLQLGKQRIETALSLRIDGFIAPAWLLSSDALQALKELGFSYTTKLHGIFLFIGSREIFYSSQALVYSVSSLWRRILSLLWNTLLFLFLFLKEEETIRLSLHPVDWKYCFIQKHILFIVSMFIKRKRRGVSYRFWIDQRRLFLEQNQSIVDFKKK